MKYLVAIAAAALLLAACGEKAGKPPASATPPAEQSAPAKPGSEATPAPGTTGDATKREADPNKK